MLLWAHLAAYRRFNTYTTLFSLQLAFIIDVIVAGVVANLPFTVLVTGAFFCDGGLLNVDGVGFLGSLLLLLPSWVVAQRNIVSFRLFHR